MMKTSLMSRSLDFAEPENRSTILSDLQRYLHGDSVCYFQDHPERCAKLQQDIWIPVIKTAQREYGVDISTTHGFAAIKQPQSTVDSLHARVDQWDGLKLAGFEKVTMMTKSYLLAMLLMDGHITVDECVRAARCEVSAQTQVWGEVEFAHRVDEVDMKRQCGAAIAFKF
jgi:ATP synthase F1 complex assembly factor 2